MSTGKAHTALNVTVEPCCHVGPDGRDRYMVPILRHAWPHPPEYREYKNQLAKAVVQIAEKILPGLSSSIEVMEAATPLTYQDWGNRYQGSLAGWTWDVKNKHITGNKLLIRTSIPNLLMAGIYASSELFLGGVPTAVHTGCMAAKLICEKKGTAPC